VARQIAKEISAVGAHPFLDEADVDIGAEFEEDIRNFLDKAQEFLVLFTPWGLERPYVWAEIGAAWIRRIPIVVILYGITTKEFQAQPNAPVFLKKRDIIRLNDIDQYFEQFGTRVIPGGGITMAEKHYDVFLSYSHKDKTWVSEFVSTLKTGGVKAWFDPADLVPGDRWQEKIQEALRESGTLIIIISPNSINSPWTFFELGAAIADKKRIIPILLEEVDLSRVPVPIRQFQILKEPSPQKAGKRVAEVIEANSGR
jgi:hypothetical protein